MSELESYENYSIGKTLKLKRKELQIELDEIAKKLNVRPNIIKNLEEENWHLINKNLYLTGLILSYSRILKLDKGLISSKIKSLHFESNVKNRKHQLINIPKNINIAIDKKTIQISLIATTFLIFIFTFIFNYNLNQVDINFSQLINEISKK